MKRTKSYRLVWLTFFLAVAMSALLLIPATLNYLEFYVALSHMYLKINSFDIYTVLIDQTPDAVISANLSIVQDSSYVGLKVLSVDILVSYNERAGYSGTLFTRKFTFSDASIGPHYSLTLPIANDTYVDGNFLGFADYNNQSSGRGEPVTLRFSPDVNLYLLGSSSAETVYLDDVTYQMPYYVT